MDDPDAVPIQPQYANVLAATRDYFRAPYALRQSTHYRKSGAPDRRFSDFDTIVTDPSQLRNVVDLFSHEVDKIRGNAPVDFLAFLDKGSSGYSGATVGAIVLSSSLSLATALPYVVVRTDKKARAERIKLPTAGVDGCTLEGLFGVLVTDHMSEGDEVLTAIADLRYFRGEVTDCIAYTCRTDLLHAEAFQHNGVRHHAIHDLTKFAESVTVSAAD